MGNKEIDATGILDEAATKAKSASDALRDLTQGMQTATDHVRRFQMSAQRKEAKRLGVLRKPQIRQLSKVGAVSNRERNQLCGCGSKKKFKNCHGTTRKVIEPWKPEKKDEEI